VVNITCPRIVIAGTQSGVGKTSLSLGIARAFARRGVKVQTFKVGPDFLDPTHLTIASGRPCYNLDTWMMGREYVLGLFARATADADLAIVEGVMGLFDGYDPESSKGSTAEMADLLGAPLLLVVNAHGMARSIAALVKGYADFEKRARLAGVIINQCGSEKHGTLLSASLKGSSLPPVVGAVLRGSVPSLPSRHLGLVAADPALLADGSLDALADAVEKQLSMEEILRISQSAPRLSGPDIVTPESAHPLRIGIARDEAFHFYYHDLFDAIKERGCDTVFFSPLHDQNLPELLDGLYIGGGYPEEYGALLSENRPMKGAIRAFAVEGRPVYAECGGLMYLSEGITTDEGASYPLTGLLPVWTHMLKRRKALGYIEVTLSKDTLLGEAGTRLRGHEFHYSDLKGDPAGNGGWQTVYNLKRPLGDKRPPEGYCRGNILASYIHLHLASRPESITRFLNVCRRIR
jgi:cobyrinic acid a,c-diamide synthase